MLEIRYTAAIIEWIKKELKTINIKTRKMMAMAGEFPQKGNSDRLYLLTKKLKRRMIRVEDCVELEGKKKYVMGSKKRLFGVVGEGMEDEESGKEHKKRGVAKLKEKLEKKQEQERILGYIKELNVEEI